MAIPYATDDLELILKAVLDRLDLLQKDFALFQEKYDKLKRGPLSTSSSEASLADDEKEDLIYCNICNKFFQSCRAKTHETSKGHQRNIEGSSLRTKTGAKTP